MIQNVDLMDAMLKIAFELKTNEKVVDFIQEQFGTSTLHVYVGEMLHKQVPTVDKTPYIVIFNCEKREGLNIDFARYTCKLAIGVGGGARPDFVEDDNGIEFLDIYDVSNKFLQLVIDVINEREDRIRPLAIVQTQGTYPMESDSRHWVTFADLEWRIYQTMGFNQEEF